MKNDKKRGKTSIVYITIERISCKIFNFAEPWHHAGKCQNLASHYNYLRKYLWIALYIITLKKAYWTTERARLALRVGYFQSTFCDMTFLLVKIYNRCVLQKFISQDELFSHLFKGHLIFRVKNVRLESVSLQKKLCHNFMYSYIAQQVEGKFYIALWSHIYVCIKWRKNEWAS